MDKILVMTDLHMTQEGQDIIGLDPALRLQAALDEALPRHPDAKALILMGDLTHNGLDAEYGRLAPLLADLPLPIIPMMGNHDRRDRFTAAFPNAPRVGDHIQHVMDLPHHRIITLDTLDGPPYAEDHHAGRLCDRRRVWLEEQLAGADGRTPLVFAHHPPFETGIPGMDAIRLADGEGLLDLLGRHAGVHLFCGHVHRTISGSTRGVPWTMWKGTCHQGPLDLVEVDSSLSLDEPGAYGVVLLPRGGVIAHSEDVGLGAAVIRGYALT